MSLLSELRRRNVLRIAAAYVVVSWLLIQVAETLFPLFGFDATPARIIVIVLTIGFVPALILAWIFELTPEGLRKETDADSAQITDSRNVKTLDRFIIVALVIAVGYFAFDKFVLDPARDAALVEATAKSARADALVESYGDYSIAVLPFTNMSPDPDQDFFADGMSEELLNLLARIPQLRVTSRSSSFAFRGHDINIPDVAAKLNVAHVLEGSVRKAGDQVRITVQLIDAASDTHLWSETYDRSLDNIFAIQDEVAAQIVDQLRITLLGAAPVQRPIVIEAYAKYLQAKQIITRAELKAYDKAEVLLDEALAIAPNYVNAMALLADVYIAQRKDNWPELQDELAFKIEQLRQRALELEPDNVDLLADIARDTLSRDDDITAAARLYEQASRIEPANFKVLWGSAILATDIGRSDLAIRFLEYVAERDPMNLLHHHSLAQAYANVGRFDDALRQYAFAKSLVDREEAFRWAVGVLRLVSGDAKGALESFDGVPHDGFRKHEQTLALHDLGREEESAECLRELHAMHQEEVSKFGDQLDDRANASFAYVFTTVYAWTGSNDKAFDYLRQAADARAAQLAEFKFNPTLPNDLSRSL